MKYILYGLFVGVLLLTPEPGVTEEIKPFQVTNQSPLVRVYGFPTVSEAGITSSGSWVVTLGMDVASNYTEHSTATEQILLDGESYVWKLGMRYGLGERYEVGVSIPVIMDGGGFLDGFIEGWHRTFGLPQGGRDTVARNKLAYRYVKNGTQQLLVTQDSTGLGDILLTGAVRLYDNQDDSAHDNVALRGGIKLPTGDSGRLQGSGAIDVSLSLCGSMNSRTEWGTLGVYGSLGGMYLGNSDILSDQQNRGILFGLAGLGWSPAEWIVFKVQVDGQSPLYHGSSLAELSSVPWILTMGGTVVFPGEYQLDIGVSEDVAVGASPDVALHLGLRKRF